MTTIESVRPLLAILTPAVAVILIRIWKVRPNVREFWTIFASVLNFAITVSMVPAVLGGKAYVFHLITILPGLAIHFRVDALGLVFALIASFLWIVTSFYSIGYMRTLKEHAQTRYYMCFAGAMAAVMGAAFAADMFTLFVFYEIITLATFPLVGHEETAVARRGARTYLVYLLGTSLAFLMFAIVLTYVLAGTLDFMPQGILAGKASGFVLTIIFILFLLGITKAAMMPLHSWLPGAMVAPTPVSAFLHAVAVVKVGVFTVLRVVLFIFGTDLLKDLGLGTALMYFASFTIIAASLVALKQDNLKKRLAYSTVSQLSYIVFAAALLSPSGIKGSVFHIAAHAFGKITLFMAAGAIYVAHKKTKVSELNGIGVAMPFTMVAFAMASISMIGIPPFGGFISKWYMFFGAMEAGHIPILLVLAVSTILNGCYFLPIVFVAFFKEPVYGDVSGGRPEGIREAPLFMVLALIITALGSMVLFFWPTLFLQLAGAVAGGG